MTELKPPSGRDRFEKQVGLAFFGALIVLAAVWHLSADSQTSARIAAIGGTIALFGVILAAIPVLRVGAFDYIAKTMFADAFGEPTITLRSEEERRRLSEERAIDLIMQNVFGPMLVGVGTVVNAFSGLF